MWSESASRILPQPSPPEARADWLFGVGTEVPVEDLPMLMAGPGCGPMWDDLRHLEHKMATSGPPLFITGLGDV